MAPKCYLTRIESVSSSHRLHSPQLSDAENLEIYGKCNHPNGHVEVTVAAAVHEKTGMVMNTVKLQAIMKEVLDTLDHKNIDKDVAFFETRVSTVENLTVYIWTEIASRLPPNILYKVKVHETDKNICIYKGEDI